MVFVPSINGKSHCEEELTTWEDCAKGVNVLLQTVLGSVFKSNLIARYTFSSKKEVMRLGTMNQNRKISLENLSLNFQEIEIGLTNQEAIEEANRCLYCYDAPCIKACPTGIDIPSFIKKIASGNLKGSAKTIMTANPVGASCARVCPTEELCEGACV